MKEEYEPLEIAAEARSMERHRHSPFRIGQLLALARDFVFLTFGKYGQYVITLVTLPLIARILGAEGLGFLSIALSSYFIGSVIGDLGITSFMAAVVGSESITQWRASYAAVRASIVTVMGIALLGCLAVGADVHVQMIVLGLFCGGFTSISDDWVLIGQGRFGVSTLYQSIGRISYLILLTLILPRYPSPSVAMVCLLVSSIPTVVLTWVDTTRRLGRPPCPRKVREVLRMAAPVLASRLLMQSYGAGSIMIYSAVINASSLGLFAASDRLVRAVQSLLDLLGYTLLPRLARQTDRSQFWRRSMLALAVTLTIAAAATATLCLVAPIVIRLVFGADFIGAVEILRVEALILPATALSSYAITAVLAVRRDTIGVLIGGIIGALIGAAAFAFAARTHSVWALVYGTLAVEASTAIWYGIRMRQLFLREHKERH